MYLICIEQIKRSISKLDLDKCVYKMNSIFAYGLVLIICSILYLWQFLRYHLLSGHVPGPRAWPILGNLLQVIDKRNGLEKMNYFHRQYGLRWRAWVMHRFVLFTINPSDIRILLSSKFALDKSDIFYRAMLPMVGQSVLISTVKKWSIIRRIIDSIMGKTTIDLYFERIERISRILHVELEKCPNDQNRFKLNDGFGFFHKFTTSLFCRNMMGLDQSIDSQIDKVKYSLTTFSHLAFNRMQTPWLILDLIYFLTPNGKRAQSAIDNLHSFSYTMVDTKCRELDDNRPEIETNRAHFFRALYRNYLNGNLNGLDLKQESLTTMIAATETTALALCYACFVIAIEPKVQHTIYEELCDVIGAEENLTFAHLNQLEYLERSILESLRLFPSVPQLARNITADIRLDDGLVLPNGVDFVVDIFGLHRWPDFWPDPLKIDPDRFLPDQCADRPPGVYIPFSKGARDCFGSRYGMLVMKITLANLIRRYEIISPHYKTIQDVKVVSHIFLYAEEGYPLEFVRRTVRQK